MIKPIFNTHLLLKGRYKCKVFSANGVLKQETDWFDNLITNQGLDQIGSAAIPLGSPFGGPYLNGVCSVGTGTTTPSFSDTQLTSYGAASSPQTGGLWGSNVAYVAGPPSYWSSVWVYTFNAGVATGTWSEIGVGNWYHTSDTQPELFSHALIVDGSGNPTTVTVLSTESLQVTYELDYYINTTTNAYSFTINSTTYSGNYLRANVTTAPNLYYGCTLDAAGGNAQTWLVYFNGTIGTISGQPSGSSAGGNNGSVTTQPSAYVSGTYFNTFQNALSISQGNLSGGITALMIVHGAQGSWQFSVSPAIPKTSSYQLTISYSISWARYP